MNDGKRKRSGKQTAEEVSLGPERPSVWCAFIASLSDPSPNQIIRWFIPATRRNGVTRGQAAFSSRRGHWATAIIALLFQLHFVSAFPPAPHHLIKGTVRNEMGFPLGDESGVVVLEAASGLRLTANIVSGLAEGMNYELRVPMDAGIHPTPYSRSALFAGASFTMRVNIGGVAYLPIEMLGDFSNLGKTGGTSVIHLTLGEDADGDGLPDAWERALLRALGLKDLQDIDPTADSDGDGLSNLSEYKSGNYAFDKSDGLSAAITGFHNTHPLVEFLAIRGRTYVVYESFNLIEWKAVSFYFPDDGGDARLYNRFQSDSVRIVQLAIPPSEAAGPARYFRVRVH